MRKGLRDPGKMYEAERRWAEDLPDRHKERLTRRQIRNLVAKICDEYGYDEPAIRWTGRGGAYWNPWYGELMFTDNRNHGTGRWIVLHEMAHVLAPMASLHDEIWLDIYADLVYDHISPKAAKQLHLLLRSHLP